MNISIESPETLQHAPIWLILLLVTLYLIWCITYYFAHRNEK